MLLKLFSVSIFAVYVAANYGLYDIMKAAV